MNIRQERRKKNHQQTNIEKERERKKKVQTEKHTQGIFLIAIQIGGINYNVQKAKKKTSDVQ